MTTILLKWQTRQTPLLLIFNWAYEITSFVLKKCVQPWIFYVVGKCPAEFRQCKLIMENSVIFFFQVTNEPH